MKKLLFGMLLLALAGCAQQGKQTPKIALHVSVEGIENGKVYLCEIQNIHYGSAQVIDTLTVTNGQIAYTNDSLRTGLYALSNEINPYGYPVIERNIFLQPGENNFRYLVSGKEQQTLSVEALDLQAKYEAFQQKLKEIDALTDSMNVLFYAAREKGDREEMARVKEASMPYYEESSRQKRAYINSSLEQEKGNTFGLYLFYAYRFQNQTFNTTWEIDSLRTVTVSYGEEAQKSEFAYRIKEALEAFEQCAIGHEAPEIAGLTQEDKPIKLSDFRGQLVLVDFWSSGCGWCRKENVYLKPAYEKYKDRGFTILGVSSDYRKEDWLKAIDEDQTHWPHLLIPRDEIRKVDQAYCIVGIPHIILVSSEGIILEKELRGEAIEQAIEKHIKK